MTTLWTLFIWWFWVQIIGLIALPLSWWAFRPLPDRGYTLSKALGLLVWGYLLWLGATVGVFSNTMGGALFALAGVAALSYFAGREGLRADENGERPLLRWLVEHRSLILIAEGLFLLAFLAWAYVRAQSPDIATAGGEKFMEIAFINGILTSRRFPPHDPWLAGYAISYYYFGYVMVAGLIQLSRVPAAVGFNVGFASWFALTVLSAFGVVGNLVGLAGQRFTDKSARNGEQVFATGWGALGALVLALMGNLEGFLEVLYARRLLPVSFWQWLDIRNINVPYPPDQPATWMPQRFIWWWQASRVIHDKDLLGNTMEVIDEFPAFSFILGDMHPHVLVLPFALLVIALALALFVQPRPDAPRQRVRVLSFRVELPALLGDRWRLLLYALALGGLAFLNTWDFPIYLALVAGIIAVREAESTHGLNTDVLRRTVAGMVVLAALGIVLYLPFYVGFQSQASGILPNLFNPTRLPQFFVMFGPLLILIGLLVSLLWRREAHPWRGVIRWLLGVWLLPWVAIALLVVLFLVTPAGKEFLNGIFANPQVQANIGGRSVGQLLAFVALRRAQNPWTFLFLGALLAWALHRLYNTLREGNGGTQDLSTFALVLTTLGLLLTYAVEFVYLRDLFGTRMNTVFKFYYQTWVLWTVAGTYALALFSREAGSPGRTIGLGVASLFIALGLVYTVFAIPARSELKQAGVTLNGEAWVANIYPDDYAIIRWVREYTKPDDIVLEATGGSYSFFGRVSAFTGRATLFGWDFHEWQWRGKALEKQAGTRAADIERIYRQARGQELLDLLHGYGVDYLVVGSQEREKYGVNEVREREFDRTLERVFEQGTGQVYRVP